MAAANILTTAATAANSSDVTIAAGATLTVALKDAAGTRVSSTARISVQLKDDTGAYFEVDALTFARPMIVLPAGTYRFGRLAGASIGVFSG